MGKLRKLKKRCDRGLQTQREYNKEGNKVQEEN